MSQDNVLPTERGERFSAVRFLKRYAVPLGDWLRPLLFAVGDGSHSGNRQGAVGRTEGSGICRGPLRTLRAGGSAETHDPSWNRAHAAEWFSKPGRAVESAWTHLAQFAGALCELLLTRSCGYKVFLGRLQHAHSTPS